MCFYHHRQNWAIIGLLLVNLVISTNDQSLLVGNTPTRKGVPDRTVPGGTRYNEIDHHSHQGQIANPGIEIQEIG